MASDRTFVTELATALGMVGDDSLSSVLGSRPPSLANLTDDAWVRLGRLWDGGVYRSEFQSGFANGQAFLAAPDALNRRLPRIIEWTGGRRPPGDEVVPADLRIDHVYLVSCKYLSRILHNPSPARLIEALLSHSPVDDHRDWYSRVAPEEYQALYEACLAALRSHDEEAVPVPSAAGDEEVGVDLPALAADLTSTHRRWLKTALRARRHHVAAATRAEYIRFSRRVSEASATRWAAALEGGRAEAMLWRILRIGSAPYFVLGADHRGSMRLRIDSPWDWTQEYRLRRFEVSPQRGLQPRVAWKADYEVRETREPRVVRGHVELRWSHGRFAQPPEAKVYLDTPHRQVPGYHPLNGDLLA